MPSDSKRLHPNRRIERESVDSARLFFGRNNIIFFEIDLRVDFGKDAVIELVVDGAPTGQWLGLQIKGGRQTVRQREGHLVRGVPFSKKDSKQFRATNIPVLGLVQESEGDVDSFLWVDMSKYCREQFDRLGEDRGGFAPTLNLLNSYRLPAFVQQMQALASNRLETATLDLVSDDAEIQQGAIVDCFVLARSDYRTLVLVRNLLLSFQPSAVASAIVALTYVVGHGDIFWTPRNNLPEPARQAIKPHLRWSDVEIAFLLGYVGIDEEEQMWGRGTFGQNICALISADRNSPVRLILIAEARKSYPRLVRRRAYILAVYLAGDAARYVSSRILRYSFDLLEDEAIRETALMIQEDGWVSIY